MKKHPSIFNILITAFILRLTLLLINTFVIILPQGGGDALTFESNAYYLSTSNYDIDYFYYLSSGARLFELLLSYIYYIIGRQPIILGLIIVLLGVYTVKLTHKASLLLWNNYAIAKKAAWFVALFPVLMLESALILREIPINVFLLLAIISFIKYWKYQKKIQPLWFVFYTICATLLHSGAIFILFGFVFFTTFYAKGKKIFSKIIVSSIIIISFLVLNANGFLNKISGGTIEDSIDLIETRENYELRGNSAYPNWIMLTDGVKDIWKIPIRFVAFLFSPLIPFWARTIWHSIGLLDAFLYLFMFYYIFRRNKMFKTNNTAKAILIMSLFLTFVFSLGVSNIGTAIRHRAKIAPLFIIVFSGIYYTKSTYKIKRL